MVALQHKSSSSRVRGKEIIEAEHGGGGSTDEEMDYVSGDDSDQQDQETPSANMGRKALMMMMMDQKDNTASPRIPTESNDTKLTKDGKRIIKNRQRVLILSSRGIVHRFRHLLNDLHVLMPHSKKESKLDTKSKLHILNELAEMSNCNNCIFFEVRKHKDLYMWLSKTPNGPSIKFHVENVHTMDELKMTGNCLKGSRPILSFDKSFESALTTDSPDMSHLPLIKELLMQSFATPKTSRKQKPFVDHIMSFSYADGRIWVRHYQIVKKDDAKKDQDISLVEIGPRFVLNVMRVFDASFGGKTLYENPNFVSPNTMRREQRLAHSNKYVQRSMQQQKTEQRSKMASVLPQDPTEKVFE